MTEINDEGVSPKPMTTPPKPSKASSIHLRRHSSLPVRIPRSLSRRSTTTRQAKSNPYLGWFRHAPPTTLSSWGGYPEDDKPQKNAYLRLSRLAPRGSCYWTQALQKPRDVYCCYTPRDAAGRLRLDERVCWRLPGGAPGYSNSATGDWKWLWNNNASSSKANAVTNSDDVVDPIVSLAWKGAGSIPDDVKHPAHLLGSYLSQHSDDESSFNSESSGGDRADRMRIDSSSSEDDSTTSSQSCDSRSTVHTQRDKALDHSLSSSTALLVSPQAEAYHAHAILFSASSSPGTRSARLDYDITQMDIVRMTRNASRHLDVESIWQLPTITYCGPATAEDNTVEDTQSKKNEGGGGGGDGWSWLMVNKEEEDDEHTVPKARTTAPKQQDRKSVCVICLEAFVKGDRLRVLPCDHSFHVGCIDQWLSGSRSFDECNTAGCPTCKKRPTSCDDLQSSGVVPAWAFTRVGSALSSQH